MKVKVTIEYEVEPEMKKSPNGSTYFPSIQCVLDQERQRFRDVLNSLNLQNGFFKVKEME